VGASPPPLPPPAEALAELRLFLTELLEAQCTLLGAAAGAVYLSAGGLRRSGLFAQHQAPTKPGCESVLIPAVLAKMERLGTDLCQQTINVGKIDTVSIPRGPSMYGEEPRLRLVASPLVAEGRTEGACVLVMPAKGGMDDSAALAVLAATAAKFEAYLWRRQCMSEVEQKLMLRQTLELLDASQQGPSAGTMGAIMCDELKRRFGCSRVSIGLVRREFIRLSAVTGTDDLDRNAPAVESLEAAMEECASQDVEIVYPQPQLAEADPSLRRVTRAHEHLSRAFGPSAILSLPLRVEGDLVGVAVLERSSDDPFPSGAAPLLRLVAETIGPALWTRRLADRGVLAVARDGIVTLGEAIVGARHTGAKLLALAFIVILIGAIAVPIPSRVTASAEVLPALARTVVPPFTGYLESVSVKAGDAVTQGQPLARMDTRDIEQEIDEHSARLSSLDTQRDEALGKSDHGKARILGAQALEVGAVLKRLRDHRSRAEIVSPITGIVGRGELDQFIGARVDPTQPLFELVSREYIAVVDVEERDIQRVKPGQVGNLVVKSRPGEQVPVRVTRVNPAAEVLHGKNVYQVEVALTGDPADAAWLRPSLTGTVKLDDGWSTTMSSLLGPIIDEMRLRMWW